ncbi:hypothetical protein SAMN02927900_05455 [Rhizobium mongolense subsp. loessense]|uniref:Uncharacterized protein n=1 Tax=Rhizobium mongolense subsp. loessense TaxID=158890 RepID=A0A1G4TQB4_9HYPH|nr:hypothetical protein [Ensifer adhaerens]SCW83572.1 hypothetical protein SAMN02927900_05455 [Rhizobium mongolense subsp. loessense]
MRIRQSALDLTASTPAEALDGPHKSVMLRQKRIQMTGIGKAVDYRRDSSGVDGLDDPPAFGEARLFAKASVERPVKIPKRVRVLKRHCTALSH